MLFKLCKRGYVAAAPWLFGQSSLPAGYKQMTDDALSLSIISKLEPGFLYAFNSILDSYETKDTESLKQCLEANLFSRVQEGFSKLSEEGIEFKRLHKDDPIMIPLSLNIHSGVNINRSENCSKSQMQIISLDEKVSQGMLSTIETIMGKKIPSHAFNLMKNSKIYIYNGSIINLIISIEVAFTGKTFLSLMKDGNNLSKNYSGNCFHIFKFESEIFRSSGPQSIVDRFALIGKFSKLNDSEILNKSWILCDIDNQLGGNPLVKD